MLNTRVALTTVVTILSLSACAPLPVTQVSSGLRSSSDAGVGYLFGSYVKTTSGQNRSHFNDSAIYFRPVGATKESGSIGLNSGDALGLKPPTPSDINESNTSGSSYCIALPPGKYEFYAASFYLVGGTLGDKRFSEKDDSFPIPFEVKSGQAIYAGELNIQGVTGKNFIGLPVVAGGKFVRTDKFERDRSLVLAKGCPITQTSIDVIPPSSFTGPVFPNN